MPAKRRFKTKYTGVYYYIEGTAAESTGKERVYYIIYRKNGRQIEEKAGRQFHDEMTPVKAAMIRAECIEGKRLLRRELRRGKKPEKKSTPEKSEIEFSNSRLLKEKWLLFMESSTDAFALLDSNLKMVEMNDATLRLFPSGTRKKDVLRKRLEEFAPGTKERGDVERFLRVIKTGEPFFMDRVVPPPKFGDRYLNYKVFKVGDGLGTIITDITELIKKEQELEKRENDLKEINTALEVLLKKREKDNAEREERIMHNVKELVEPYLEKIRSSRLDRKQKAYLDILQSNLKEIVSPLVQTLSTQYQKLTPFEIQVANLVKLGKASKEIAEMFHLSPRTVETHRMNIRKKLGIKRKKINLQTYLSSLR